MAYRDVTFRAGRPLSPESRGWPRSVSDPLVVRSSVGVLRAAVLGHDIHYDSALTPERARSMDAVVAPTEWHRRYLCRRYPFLEGKVHAIPNGLDASRFRDAGHNEIEECSTRQPPNVGSTSCCDYGRRSDAWSLSRTRLLLSARL